MTPLESLSNLFDNQDYLMMTSDICLVASSIRPGTTFVASDRSERSDAQAVPFVASCYLKFNHFGPGVCWDTSSGSLVADPLRSGHLTCRLSWTSACHKLSSAPVLPGEAPAR